MPLPQPARVVDSAAAARTGSAMRRVRRANERMGGLSFSNLQQVESGVIVCDGA
jgi:hypothetical protein